MPNSNNYLQYIVSDKIFKISISKYSSFLKKCVLHKVENVTIINEALSQDGVRLEWLSHYVYIPKWIPCGYFFFRPNFLRIIEMKYAIIIKNTEKPKAETVEIPPEPGLA